MRPTTPPAGGGEPDTPDAAPSAKAWDGAGPPPAHPPANVGHPWRQGYAVIRSRTVSSASSCRRGDPLDHNRDRGIAPHLLRVVRSAGGQRGRGRARQGRHHRACARVPVRAKATCWSRTSPASARRRSPRRSPRSIDGSFGRIQFTPDLLPSDVVGVSVWNRGTGDFVFRPGPVFANVVARRRGQPRLAEDAVGAPRGDGRAAGDRRRHDAPARPPLRRARHREPDRARGHLPAPREPARPLLHAPVDGLPRSAGRDRAPRVPHRPRPPRCHRAGHHDRPDGRCSAMRSVGSRSPRACAATSSNLAEATRDHPGIMLGMSPRATLTLQHVARAHAAIRGRSYVIPDDVRSLVVTGRRPPSHPHARGSGAGRDPGRRAPRDRRTVGGAHRCPPGLTRPDRAAA